MAVSVRTSIAAAAAPALLAAAMTLSAPASAHDPACGLAAMGTPCVCDLATLRPLQGAVGMNEVAWKEARIARHPKRAHDALASDPVKVVLGPEGRLYVTDHHHGAAAWLKAGTRYGSTGYCEIVNGEKGLPTTFASEAEFWTTLKAAKLARFRDEDGKDIDALPQSFGALGDDRYRDLAWLVREAGGFCKGDVEYAEFAWADFYRGKGLDMTRLPSEPCLPSPTVEKAVGLAHSDAARGLPGFSPTSCRPNACER